MSKERFEIEAAAEEQRRLFCVPCEECEGFGHVYMGFGSATYSAPCPRCFPKEHAAFHGKANEE